MTQETQAVVLPEKKKGTTSAFARVARFMGVRAITLFFTVVVGVYTTILIANMGGYVDTIRRNDIRERVNMQVAALTAKNLTMTAEARRTMADQMIALEEDRLGLNTPFAIRSFRYLADALQLNLGRAQQMVSDHGSREVRNIILERLPATLLLMGTSQLFLFFFSVFIALTLSRAYGSFWDKLVITLSPTSAAPPWFYGIFFILLFAAVFRILPFGGMVDLPCPTIRWNLP